MFQHYLRFAQSHEAQVLKRAVEGIICLLISSHNRYVVYTIIIIFHERY